MARVSKRMKAIREKVDRARVYDLGEAIRLLKELKATKFDETVEISINLGVDPRHADQMVRGSVTLPHGLGKDVKVAVFARGPKAEEAKAAGADRVGDEDLAKELQSGDIPYDRIIATPDMMAIVGKLGRILGPRGLMPNPKLGTVTMDVTKAVKEAKAGQVQFRVDKTGIVHAGVGKLSFDEDKIAENIQAFVDAVIRAKPSGAKGQYVKKVTISSTMGPGLPVDLQSIQQKLAA